MERMTRLMEGTYYLDVALIQDEQGYFGKAIDRLATFENIVDDLTTGQVRISEELEKLRSEGKEKSVRFKELMVKKLTNVNTMMLLKSYGIE